KAHHKTARKAGRPMAVFDAFTAKPRSKEHHRALAIEGRRKVRPHLRPGHFLPRPIWREIPHALATTSISEQFNGSAADVMLQGFHWTSCRSNNPNWYQILAQNASAIKDAKFD